MMTAQSKSRNLYWPWLICSLGAIYYCYEYFLRITPSVITPELMSTYHLTGAQVGNLSAFYYHAYMPMQIIVGLLMDRFGPRRLLTLACLLCAVGTYLFAGTHNLMVAQAGRFLVGFGSAFAFVGSLKLATIWLPPNRFALVSGIITCLGMMGAMAGDIVLRALIDVIGWQVTIYISAGAGVLLAAILWGFIRDTNPQNPHPDLHVTHFKELIRGLWGALKNPQIWLTGIIGFLLYLSLSAFGELWGISYLEQAQGFSKTHAATANSMIFLGWAIGGPFWGWFSDYIGRRALPITVASALALIVISVLLYLPGLSVTSVYVLLFLFGLLTSVEILVFAICREVSSIKIAGTAIALTNMLVMIGGNIFQPVMGKILDLYWTGAMVDGARLYPISAYHAAMSILPISMLIAVFATLFIRETYGKVD
jgi:sugar phosphate permease